MGIMYLKIRYAGPGENKPYTGSDSFLYSNMLFGKSRKTLLFSSCGEYA